jgi:hypothetical protein
VLVAEGMIDGLVDAARTWGADAVVYPPPAVAGLVAARAIGVPAVLHGIGTRRPTSAPPCATWPRWRAGWASPTRARPRWRST